MSVKEVEYKLLEPSKHKASKKKSNKRRQTSCGQQEEVSSVGWKKVDLSEMSIEGFEDGCAFELEELTDYDVQKTENGGSILIGRNDTNSTSNSKKQEENNGEERDKEEDVKEEKGQVKKNNKIELLDLDKIPKVDLPNWSRFKLHPLLLHSLFQAQFTNPTEIQAKTIHPALIDNRDIVGAAPTGSGKTLAFGLPILHCLLEERKSLKYKKECKALILTPTRELALQIHQHLECMVPNREIGIVTVVGGMAIQKQKRLLSYAPEIVIGTPGRLWDLIENTHPHLESISRKLRFLVVDEADRMLQNGSYPEMEKIFNKLRENTQKKTKSKATSTDLVDLSESEEEENDDNQNDSALFGEIKAPTFQDILKIQQQMKDQNLQKEKQEIETHKEKDLFCPPCVRQTFLFSATLTIPESGRFQKGTKKKMQNALSVLENVMARVGLRGKPAVVDLSATDDESKQNNKKKKNQKEKEDQDPKITAAIAKEDLKKQNIRKNTTVSLPQGLELCQYEVTDSTRDNYLYYFLTQYPGHTIIFLNAIQQVRKVSNLLALLKLPAFALHAEMQQRQRLKKLDAFRAHKNGILVATDVAARGLDIPSVQYVVHYHIARSTEVFIHRSGRTARAQQDGLSLSFVSPSDAKYHAQICKLLERPTGFSEFPFDHRFLPPIEERVKLAKDIASEENSTGKIKSEENWFAQMAEAADLELDDELMKEFQNKKQFKKNNGKHKKESVTSQRMTLDRLLSQSLRPVGSSRKFRHIHQELGTTISTDGEYKKRDAADDLEKKSKKSFKRFRRR